MAAATTIVALLGAARPAGAGGWWNSIDPGAGLWAPGLHVRATAGLALFPTPQSAKRAVEHGSYYAYLLEDFDYDVVDRALGERFRPRWWSLGGATATRLGPLDVRGRDADLVRASARVTIPDVEPGRYYVMFCNLGCRRSFADVIPTRVTVVADRVAADLSRQIQQLRDRAGHLESSLRTKLFRLGRRVDRLARTLKERPSAESAPPSAAASAAGRSSAGPPVLLGAAGVVVVLGGLAAVLGRRRRHSTG